MEELDWDKGIPLGVISLVAVLGGPEMAVMRGVSKTWTKGYDDTVKKIRIDIFGPVPPADFASRFSSLEILDIGGCPMPEASLSCLSGLQHLSNLCMGRDYDGENEEENPFRGSGPILAYTIRNAGLELLKGLPITSLDLTFCIHLTEAGLIHLKGLPLARLELMGTNFHTLEHLRGLSLTYLGLSMAHLSKDTGMFPFYPFISCHF